MLFVPRRQTVNSISHPLTLTLVQLQRRLRPLLHHPPKTAAEPRASPRQLKSVDFQFNEKISGDLSDLKGLTRLGWTPLGRSRWVPKSVSIDFRNAGS